MSEETTSKPNGSAGMRSLASILLDRAAFMRQAGITFGGARDTYEIFGYDRIITAKQYRDQYARGGISKRLVEVLPKATWRGDMELIEDEDPEHDTPFEKAWEDLETRLKIKAVLQRADILAGLSTYSVILIGGPGDFSQELPKGRPEQLVYLTPFAGGGGPGPNYSMSSGVSEYVDATIQTFETDATNERFGLPATYQLRRLDVVSPELMKPVHWSRVIHIAEGCLDNEVYGPPTLESVWNLLQDLEKVTGGGAEAFFLRANQGLQLDIDKDMSLSTEEKDALKTQADEYQHSIRRMLRTRGVTVNPLGSDVANFANPADAIITQIAGSRGIPKRILTGSEMGELASSQDRENFKDIINGRQTGYAGPYMVRPLVDRLIKYGYLPTPAKGPMAYEVRWPHIQTLTEQEKAQGANQWASTNSTQGSLVFTPAEIRDKWYGMAPLTPEQIAEAAPPAEAPPPAVATDPVTKMPVVVDTRVGLPAHQTHGMSDDEKRQLVIDEKAKKAEEDAAKKKEQTAQLQKLKTAGDVEGHEFHGNQWTGSASKATRDAVEAGKRASADGFVDDHLRASDLHTEASHIHKSEGNSDQATTHEKSARWHASEARYKSKQVSKYIDAADEAKKKGDSKSEKWNREQAQYLQSGRGKLYVKRVLAESEDAELLRVLEEAIRCNNTEVIDKIIGVERVLGDTEGHPFHGNQWTHGGSDADKFISSPSDAINDLANGGHATVVASDVRDVLERAANSKVDPIDLTRLTIEGTPIFAGGLNKPRNTMPQISKEDQPDFLKHLGEKNIGVKNENVAPAKLLPTQSEISANRVGVKLREYDKGKKDLRAIMVSKDNYVLDGHHRWAVMATLDAENPRLGVKMPVIRIMADHDRALKVMRDYTKAKGIANRSLEHKYASTQVQLPKEMFDALLAFPIPDEDLIKREDDPHVTVKYGIVSDDPKQVVEELSDQGPVALTLGRVGFFSAPEHDVVFVNVESDDLHRLNRLIYDNLEVVNTQDTYHPHATLAYVRPGAGAKYVGDERFVGMTATVDSVQFCSADDGVTEIPLDEMRAAGDSPGHEFHGNQWTDGGAVGIVVKEYKSIGIGPVDPNYSSGADQARAGAKEAHKQLVKAGYVKGEKELKNRPSEKMGHSTAYTGSSLGSETHYAHPDGRTAVLKTDLQKYRESRVVVRHTKAPE